MMMMMMMIFVKLCLILVLYNVKNYGKAGQATDGNITRRMRFAFWIINAADTHSEYVIVIAVSLQQWSCERALVLRYAYIACLVMLFYCSQRYDSN